MQGSFRFQTVRLFLFASAALLAIAISPLSAAEESYQPPRCDRQDVFRFEQKGDATLTLFEGCRPVLAYNYGFITGKNVPESDYRRRRAAYVHPIWGLSGEILTDDFPRDHYHHHGLFWAWLHVVIDGRDYDLWTGRDIRQQFVRWMDRETGPDAAVLGVENGWFTGERKVMIERVWLRVFPADADSRAIDVRITWTPVDRDVTLLGAEGKSYGGLGLRFNVNANSRPVVITVPSGPVKDDLKIVRLPWADLTASFAKDAVRAAKSPGGKPADSKDMVRSGAAIFVCPDHPDYPPTWLTRHYGPLCVGWPGVESKTFPAGKPFTLSYRIWIHKGDVDAKLLTAVYEDFIAGEHQAEWSKPQ